MRCLKITKWIFRFKVVLLAGIICYYCGVFTYLFEESYEDIDKIFIPNVLKHIELLEKNQTLEVRPINYYNYSFITNSPEKCDPTEFDNPLRLVYLIKSATDHFERREAIRNSWGFEKRFSDVTIKTVFILGLPSDENVQFEINYESRKKGDIIQASFVDSYYNNTIKTMMAIKWAATFCSNSKFYFFSDDDMYVSTKNVLKFIRNPLEYPSYLEVPFSSVHRNNVDALGKKWPLGQVFDIELPDDAELFAGYMFPSSRPHRLLFYSKWYITLKEYPYSRYPPYITAGAYVLSNVALKKFFYASFYVKHFRFDDIYIGLLAKASHIVPVHNDEIYYYKKPYSAFDYKYVIASHGYSDPQDLLKVWHEQKSIGNA